MVNYFMSRPIYFHEPEAVKIKPESEISCRITLMSIIIGLFYTRYLRTLCKVGCRASPNPQLLF